MRKKILGAAVMSILLTNTVLAEVLKGVVKSADGKLVTNVSIRFVDLDLKTMTDSNGQFEVELAPGYYTLDVEGGSQAHFHQSVTVLANQITEMEITLEDEPSHKIVVSANPLEHTALDMATPVLVLGGDELVLKRAGTLGEILQNQPGVSMASFGPAVARPVIRGLGGSRVQISNNQMLVQDASTNSADHDVGIEPLLAEQIEVVKGPAALLYGSGAIGGVVNVTDRKINTDLLEETTGGLEVRLGDQTTAEKSLIFAIDSGTAGWNFHVDGYSHESDDLRIPGDAESAVLQALEADQGDTVEHEESSGLLENSSLESRGGSVGVTQVTEWGHWGYAISQVDKNYGVPGHAHHEEFDLPAAEEEEEGVAIDMSQTRHEFQTQFNFEQGLLDFWFLGVTHTNYRHFELEGSEVGTRFKNDASELKSYLKHHKWNGWQGVLGAQFVTRDFSAVGEEVYSPSSKGTMHSIFMLEEKEFDALKWELGFRWESSKISAEGYPSERDDGFSLSSGVVYSLAEHNKLAFNFSKATRFASVEELYSLGAHLATQSIEIGNPFLKKEISNNLDLSYRFELNDFNGEINLFNNQFNDFIYGSTVDASDSCVSSEMAMLAEAEELKLVCYLQQDARFSGVELSVDFPIAKVNGHEFRMSVFADSTRAVLDDGSYVPRIPPKKWGVIFNHEFDQFSAQLSWTHVSDQNKVAVGELITNGFELLDLEMTYRTNFDENDLMIFVKGNNLTNQEARDHSSFLKDLAPRAGRSVSLGMRYSF